MPRLPIAAALLATQLAAPSPAAAFEFSATEHGDPIRWSTAPVDLELAVHDSAGYGPRVMQSIRAAARTWNRSLPAPMELALAEAGVGGHSAVMDPYDGRNLLVWMGDDWDDDLDPLMLAGTVTAYYPDTGEIVDTDVAINSARYAWMDGESKACANAFDLTTVLIHELGHVLGLEHTDDPASIMFAQIGACERKRTLSPDDAEGAEFLYADLAERAPSAGVGCAVGGAPAGGTWLVLIAALAVTSLRRRRRPLALALLATLAVSDVAAAAVARDIGVEELAARAASVVRGRVVEQRVIVIADRVYTETTLEVTDCWAGRCADRVVVRQLGGVRHGLRIAVSGTPEIAPGDEYVLFLRARRDGAASVLGAALGAFALVEDEDGRLRAVRDLRELALADEHGAIRTGALEVSDVLELRARVLGVRRANHEVTQ